MQKNMNHTEGKQTVGAGSKPVHMERFANGDIACKGWGDRIDRSVCMVRGIRHPEKCTGCALNL